MLEKARRSKEVVRNQNSQILLRDSLYGKISSNRTILMGMAMLSIMLFHQEWTSIPPLNAFHIWGHYGVDIFLFVSGLGIASSLKKNTLIDFYKHRISRLLPLCIFCGTCKYIIYYLNSNLLHDYGDKISLLTIFGLDLWFIQTIWGFYFLSPFLKCLIDKSTSALIFIILLLCFLTSVIIPEVQNTITGSINRLPVFVLGMLFENGRLKWNNRIASFSYIMLTLAMISTLLVQKDFFHFGNDLWMYPILAFGMLALLYTMLFFVNKLTIYLRNIIYSIGSHSLELYLWHEFIFASFWLSLNKYLNYYFVLLLAFIVSFFFAYLSTKCVKRLLNIYNSVRI